MTKWESLCYFVAPAEKHFVDVILLSGIKRFLSKSINWSHRFLITSGQKTLSSQCWLSRCHHSKVIKVAQV